MPSPRSIAEVAVGLLMVVVLRSLAELFRIDGCISRGHLTDGRAYLVGAMAAAAAALVAFALLVRNRERIAIVVALCTVAGLFIYKLISLV